MSIYQFFASFKACYMILCKRKLMNCVSYENAFRSGAFLN
eukprot:UN14740